MVKLLLVSLCPFNAYNSSGLMRNPLKVRWNRLTKKSIFIDRSILVIKSRYLIKFEFFVDNFTKFVWVVILDPKLCSNEGDQLFGFGRIFKSRKSRAFVALNAGKIRQK